MHNIIRFSVSFQETIKDAIEDTITWPVRNIVPIIPGNYRYVKAHFILNGGKRFI